MKIDLSSLTSRAMPVWVKPVAILLLIVALIAGGYWWGSSATANAKDAEIGRMTTAWTKQLATAQAAVTKAVQSERAKERKAATDIAKITTDYREKLNHEQARTADAERRLRNRTDRVSIPVYLPTACGSSGGETTATTAGADGTARAELQGEAASDLEAIAGDADALAIKFGALQDVVRKYQEVCGSP